MRAELPAPVEELVAALRNPITQIEFLNLLYEAEFLEPVLVDAETAARMVRPTRGSSTASAPRASSSPAPATSRQPTWRPRPPSWAYPDQPTPDGALFARAALRTWPA
jgi:hypothetical protein